MDNIKFVVMRFFIFIVSIERKFLATNSYMLSDTHTPLDSVTRSGLRSTRSIVSSRACMLIDGQ